MSLRKTAFRGSLVLTLGEGVNYGCSFVRNMILARILTKADFGIGASFALIMMLLEFSSRLGVARFVVQDKDGDSPEFLATAHMVQFFASAISSLLLAVAAWPMALLLGIEDQIGAVLVLAVIPLFHGVYHLDTRRFERGLRFVPSAIVDAIPQVIITLLAWPIGVWLADYRAVLLLMVTKALLSWGASHVMAEQRYRWRFHKEYALRMLRFGWPLVVNGFVLFFVMRGDQFIVASFYLMDDFGAYAAAAALTMAPMFFFRRVFASVMLPLMARAQDDPVVFNRRYNLIIAIVCVFTTGCTVTIIAGAESLMQLVFGKKYVGSGFLLAWLTAVNAFRSVRLAPSISAIAKGDSVNQMISNLGAGAGLVPALTVAAMGLPIWTIPCAGLAGELSGCLISFLRLKRRDGVPMLRSVWPTTLVGASVGLAGAAYVYRPHGMHPCLELGLAVCGGVLLSTLVAFTLSASRHEAFRVLSHCRAMGWRGCLHAIRKWLPLRKLDAS